MKSNLFSEDSFHKTLKALLLQEFVLKKMNRRLVGRNLNVDPNIDTGQAMNIAQVIRIGSEFVDFRRKVENGVELLKEEEIGKNHDERKNVNQREFVKVDFEDVTTVHHLHSAAFGFRLDKKRLDDVEMNEDYFSFLVYYPNEEIKLRYSFKRAHAPKKPRLYFKEDRLKFGYFTTIRHKIPDYTYEYHGDQDKLVFMRKFYPENGKIIYHFSDKTPDHLRDMGRKAIDEWNKVFRETNTGIEIVLKGDRKDDVKLGDIRYNILNLIDTQDGSGLYGFGPSVADSHSGEIISTSSNIYANPSRETWIEVLRNFVRAELGMFDKKYLEDPKNEPLDPPISLLDTAISSLKDSALALNDEIRFFGYRELLNEDIPSKQVFTMLLEDRERRYPEQSLDDLKTFKQIHDVYQRELDQRRGDWSLVELDESYPLHMRPFKVQKSHDIKLAKNIALIRLCLTLKS